MVVKALLWDLNLFKTQVNNPIARPLTPSLSHSGYKNERIPMEKFKHEIYMSEEEICNWLEENLIEKLFLDINDKYLVMREK